MLYICMYNKSIKLIDSYTLQSQIVVAILICIHAMCTLAKPMSIINVH